MFLLNATVAFAQSHIINIENKRINVNTSATVFPVGGHETNIGIAVLVNDIAYLNRRLAQDPEVINKINNLRPVYPIGFSANKSQEMYDLLFYASPNFINMISARDNKNYISFVTMNWFETLRSNKARELLRKEEADIRRANLGMRIKNGVLLTRAKQEEFENRLSEVIEKINIRAINTVDNKGNTSLHYLVSRGLPNATKKLLDNHLFHRERHVNNFGENALFMLLHKSCNIDYKVEDQQKILYELLNAGLNPLQRNIAGLSFASIVFFNQEHRHLREILKSNLNRTQNIILEQEINRKNEILSAGANRHQDIERLNAATSFHSMKIGYAEDIFACPTIITQE